MTGRGLDFVAVSLDGSNRLLMVDLGVGGFGLVEDVFLNASGVPKRNGFCNLLSFNNLTIRISRD